MSSINYQDLSRGDEGEDELAGVFPPQLGAVRMEPPRVQEYDGGPYIPNPLYETWMGDRYKFWDFEFHHPSFPFKLEVKTEFGNDLARQKPWARYRHYTSMVEMGEVSRNGNGFRVSADTKYALKEARDGVDIIIARRLDVGQWLITRPRLELRLLSENVGKQKKQPLGQDEFITAKATGGDWREGYTTWCACVPWEFFSGYCWLPETQGVPWEVLKTICKVGLDKPEEFRFGGSVMDIYQHLKVVPPFPRPPHTNWTPADWGASIKDQDENPYEFGFDPFEPGES